MGTRARSNSSAELKLVLWSCARSTSSRAARRYRYSVAAAAAPRRIARRNRGRRDEVRVAPPPTLTRQFFSYARRSVVRAARDFGAVVRTVHTASCEQLMLQRHRRNVKTQAICKSIAYARRHDRPMTGDRILRFAWDATRFCARTIAKTAAENVPRANVFAIHAVVMYTEKNSQTRRSELRYEYLA